MGEFRNFKIALVADELTSECLALECKIHAVTPANYKAVFKSWRPDVFFVESAWSGKHNAWKYIVAAYPNQFWRTNRQLRRALECARELNIPTIFWNKEDGVHFNRFIDSAVLFEHIFTVDENCIPKYKDVVSPDVGVETLMFAVQPKIHYPGRGGNSIKRACFLGSYSLHIHERRRQWQKLLFRASEPIGLTVFDRNSNRKSENYRYPEMSHIEVRPAVGHAETAQIYRDYLVSLNVNTIEDSQTMFSRRLIEILGCGGIAVTNPAKSVDSLFQQYCHVVNDEEEAVVLFKRLQQGPSKNDIERAHAGAEYVHGNHAWYHRLGQIAHKIK